MGKLRNKKTGEIVDLSIFGITLNIRKEEQPTYHSIEGVCEDWEDVEEPLIKDEKIRKAIRAWAEASGATSIVVFDCDNAPGLKIDEIEFAENDGRASISFKTSEKIDIDTSKAYTITELCGEEEE